MQIYLPQRGVQCILTSGKINLLWKNYHPIILQKAYFIEIMFACSITKQRTTLPKGCEKKLSSVKFHKNRKNIYFYLYGVASLYSNKDCSGVTKTKAKYFLGLNSQSSSTLHQFNSCNAFSFRNVTGFCSSTQQF